MWADYDPESELLEVEILRDCSADKKLVIKDINGLKSNIWELFILVIGLLAFLIIYFSITKLFGVNKLNPLIKI